MTQAVPIGSAEACSTLGIDRSTLTRWVKDGRITALSKLPGKSGAFLFDPAEVARVLAEIEKAIVDAVAGEPSTTP